MGSRSAKRWGGLAACALAAGAVLGCTSVRSAVRNVHNEDMVGRLAPELTGGEWIGSPRVIPASNRFDDWTLVAFFRPWDSAGAGDVPRLVLLQRSYRDRGLRVLGVTEAPRDRVEEFISTHSVTYPILTDALASEQAYGVEMLWGTEVFLVDPGGIVVADKLANAERMLAEKLGRNQ